MGGKGRLKVKIVEQGKMDSRWIKLSKRGLAWLLDVMDCCCRGRQKIPFFGEPKNNGVWFRTEMRHNHVDRNLLFLFSFLIHKSLY